MKKGKIILSAAAFIVTAGTAFAMKAHGAFSGKHIVYGTVGNVCTRSTCSTDVAGTGTTQPICKTVVQSTNKNVVKTVNSKYFASRTTNGKCTKPTVKWTHQL